MAADLGSSGVTFSAAGGTILDSDCENMQRGLPQSASWDTTTPCNLKSWWAETATANRGRGAGYLAHGHGLGHGHGPEHVLGAL
eukprot:jgi/Tetstr1/448143/TSEL_035436.t1